MGNATLGPSIVPARVGHFRTGPDAPVNGWTSLIDQRIERSRGMEIELPTRFRDGVLPDRDGRYRYGRAGVDG